MKFAEGSEIEFETELCYSNNTPVQVVRFKNEMEILSSTIYGGGLTKSSTIIIIQVPKNYCCENPIDDVIEIIKNLNLPKNTVGFMTAAEVEYVFNVKHGVCKDSEAYAIVTAGLSNQVIAGDELLDWETRHQLSLKRSAKLYKAGTINTIVVSPLKLSPAGKVNAVIASTEAKTAAMNILEYKETGTTSDAIAIVSPIGSEIDYAGTGSNQGIAMARAVRDAVCTALIIRDDFPENIDDRRKQQIRERFGFK